MQWIQLVYAYVSYVVCFSISECALRDLLRNPSYAIRTGNWAMQPPHIPITALSQTHSFLDRISHLQDSRGRTTTNHKKLIWRHCITEPELPFYHKRKRSPKINRSVKMPRHRFSMGVVCSYSLAPGLVQGYCGLLCYRSLRDQILI